MKNGLALGVLLARLALLALLAGCRSTRAPWNGRVDLYGTMREVMMEQKTQGRVELSTLSGDPELVGIGALEQLAGEVVILDGVVWCTRSGDLGTLDTRAGAAPGELATVLAVARVPHWIRVSVPPGLAASGIEAFVEKAAREHGLGRAITFPFVIEGEFRDVRAHVLHGRCPYMGKGPRETEPVRRLLPSAKGRLVGFYTTLSPGTLTHMGEKTHVHLLVKEGEPLAAHVDALRIEAGAVLELPVD
ncbi:MAG: acetolactate decarboxylase [Planctomycetes bacterium]|nr:acetolactate decarboxylase [Planctomycetota bacterium]